MLKSRTLIYPEGTNEKEIIAYWKKKNLECIHEGENVFRVKEMFEGSFDFIFTKNQMEDLEKIKVRVGDE
jgi:hypothetical protein